jgi:hypothetical protein
MSASRLLSWALGAGVSLVAARAIADEPPPPVPSTETVATPTNEPKNEAKPEANEASDSDVPEDLAHIVFDDGRKSFKKLEKGSGAQWEAHGELQLRAERDSQLPLQPPVSDPTSTTLGQRTWGTTWIRVGSQAYVGDRLRLVVQLDLVPHWIFGDLAQGVGAAGDWARDTTIPSLARLRYAFLDYRTTLGLLRVGQMGSHWGLGIVANDGDHARLFGDYRNGSIVERVAFATKPGGERSSFVIALAGDAVIQDNTAKWVDGDRAYQAVLAAYYEKGPTFAGFYGVRRWQKVASGEGDIRAWVLDFTAKSAVSVGESGNVFAYGGFEAATIFGSTDAIRTTPEFNEQTIRSFGGAANVGLTKRAKDDKGREFGRLAIQLDGGYASGDADPYDGTIKRFTFDPNHQVGLVMFPFAMHFMTARAATNATDADLVARGLPGSRFLASHGGVFGAQYLNPTVVVRPTADFDLKFGLLVAVATSDVVDPYRLGVEGNARNYRGGDARSRDLGIEIDYGFEWRVPISRWVLGQLGFQGGVLFPGHAFDDASGTKMNPQSVMQARVGMQF